MKKVYVCSRYRTFKQFTQFTNIEKALRYSIYIYNKGHLPICPHYYLSYVTGLNESNNRERLIELGIELVKVCDEMWVFHQTGISEGMKQEIEFAEANDIKIVYIDPILTWRILNDKKM